MRKLLLAVLMVVSGGGLLLVFCFALLVQAVPEEGAAVNAFPKAVPETPLWILQITEYRGPFLEHPESRETVCTAAILVENRGGLYLSAGAVILQRQEAQLVFELRDLPPGGKALVLEKDAQSLSGAYGWRCCGWAREEYPEQWGWLEYEQLPEGLAVTNISDRYLPVVELTWKRRESGSDTYVGGISFRHSLRDLEPGETKILSPDHYSQNRIDVVKMIVYWED